MDFQTFQDEAIKTAIYPDTQRISYPSMGLAGETGEVLNKVKKVYRDSGGVFTEELKKEIAKELGDVLWYAAALSRDLGIPLEEVAQATLTKLKDRQQRNMLGGSGDNR